MNKNFHMLMKTEWKFFINVGFLMNLLKVKEQSFLSNNFIVLNHL